MSSKAAENQEGFESLESSGDEWDANKVKKEKNSVRKSSRINRTSASSRKKIVEESDDDTDESELEEEEEAVEENESDEEEIKFIVTEDATKKRKTPSKTPQKPKAAKNSRKKQKISNDSDLSNDKDTNTDSDSSRTGSNVQSRGVHRKFIPKTIYSEDYATGSFVILKKDAQGGDPTKHPVIWRIDGKALLQKYEAFDEDDTVMHKNTSIYTGWSPLDKDLYAPLTVHVIRHNNNNLTVEVLWDKLKAITCDSIEFIQEKFEEPEHKEV